MALLLAKMEEREEAHALYEQVLQGRTETLGPDHPTTVETKGLAGIFRA